MRLLPVVVLLGLTACASVPERSATDLALEELSKGRCETVIEGFNRGMKDGDSQAHYWTGAMLHYGLCLKQDPARAVPYLEFATKYGVSKAARLLVLTHGLGRGVLQSYAEAGRWTQASRDIEALARQGRGMSTEERAMTMPTSSWVSFGVAGTFQALFSDKTTHPNMQPIYRGSNEGSVDVEVSLGPDGLTYTLSEVKVQATTPSGGMRARLASRAFRAELEAGIAAALKELPEYPRPDKPFRFRFETAFLGR